MSAISWLKAIDCPLLQTSAEGDSATLRLVQRLLEVALYKTTSDDLAKALLEEIASAVRADQAGIWEATPQWMSRWQYLRRGAKADLPPRPLLSEALDRQAGFRVAPDS